MSLRLHSKTWVAAATGIGLSVLLTGSSMLFAGYNPVSIICLVNGSGFGLAWLITRGTLARAGLPRTGLELLLLAFLVGTLIAMAFSPAPRLGLERAAWYGLYGLLFFLLLDLCSRPDYRSAMRRALLLVSGLVLLAALLETYAWYSLFWAQAGGLIMPPYPYRFTSLAGHSSYFMAMANLCAPLAVITFLKTTRRSSRIASGFWLVMYLFCLPFASSRAGWLGTAAWIGALAFLHLWKNARWEGLFRRAWHYVLFSIVGVLGLLLAGSAAAVWFYRVFAAASPTHGSGTSINRELMWANAIKLWIDSPWIGVGPGRLGLEYLRVTQAFPTSFWPWHAHSTPLQILAESGLAGFVPFAALVLLAGWKLVQAYRSASPQERPWARAALAALFGLAVQAIFDDMTLAAFVVGPALFQIACLFNAAGPVPRFRKLPVLALVVPALLVSGAAAFSLWGSAPLYQAREQASNGQWQAAAVSAEQSVQRDPMLPLYHSQAAIAWSMIWQETRQPDALSQARSRLVEAQALDPDNSLLWADLAALDWQLGRTQSALNAIRKAAQLCPAEPSFPLNLGWYLEQLGQVDEAAAQYQLAIELAPESAAHPFWQTSALRRAALLAAANTLETVQPIPISGSFPNDLASIRAGGQVVLAKQTGSEQAILDRLSAVPGQLQYDYGFGFVSEFAYSLYYGRRGIQQITVPGFMKITKNPTAYKDLEALWVLQNQTGDYPAAEHTWSALQRELNAGALPRGGYPSPPPCP